MKKLIIFLILIFLIMDFSSAIKISPTQQKIVMKQYETKCVNIWVLPYENYLVSSKWAINGKGDLSKYDLTKEKIKLDFNYSSSSDGKYEFCFSPNSEGILSGIIYFYSEDSMVEIGSWIDLEVEGIPFTEEIERKIVSLTGNSIKDIEGKEIALGGIFVLLLVVLVFVVFFVRGNARGKI